MGKKLLSFLLALSLLFLPNGCAIAAENAEFSPNILIAYFSWAGHTKEIAQEIQAQTGGDLFEIQPETPYTDNINELSGIALQEQRDNVRPPLSTHGADMDKYVRVRSYKTIEQKNYYSNWSAVKSVTIKK